MLGNPLAGHARTPGRRSRSRHGLIAVAFLMALGALAIVATPATAKTSAKPKPKTTTPAPALANLKIQAAAVTIKAAGKSKFVAAKDGQALHQGDALKTDATGKAEIDYTDGSLTRLGSLTEFTITKLTNERGGRQAAGTITVGETWSRVSKVSESSSFEIKAGGTTAAVEGTAFSFTCTLVNGQLSCTVIAVVDNVRVTSGSGGVAELTPATKVVAVGGNLGPIVKLTFDDLSGNVQIAGNLVLDQQAGKGKGLGDLPPAPPPPPTTPTTPPATVPPPGGGGGNVPPARPSRNWTSRCRLSLSTHRTLASPSISPPSAWVASRRSVAPAADPTRCSPCCSTGRSSAPSLRTRRAHSQGRSRSPRAPRPVRTP